MLAKLSADILDRLNIFVLEIEELQIPQVAHCFTDNRECFASVMILLLKLQFFLL